MLISILLSSVCLCGEAPERASGCVLEDDNVESRAYAPFLRASAEKELEAKLPEIFTKAATHYRHWTPRRRRS